MRRSLAFKMLVFKCNFLLQPLSKINANFSRFYCNKNLPYLLYAMQLHRIGGNEKRDVILMFDNHIALRCLLQQVTQ